MTAAAARCGQCAIVVGFAGIAIAVADVADVAVAIVADVAAAAAIGGWLWWRLGRHYIQATQAWWLLLLLAAAAVAAAGWAHWRRRCGIQLCFNIGRKLSLHCAGECIEPA